MAVGLKLNWIDIKREKHNVDVGNNKNVLVIKNKTTHECFQFINEKEKKILKKCC